MRKTQDMTVLIVGKGGREHALYDAIRKSPRVRRVVVAPGNAGIPDGDREPLDLSPVGYIADAARKVEADLVVCGPEGPLAGGLWEACGRSGIPVFGPSRRAALLEGSKLFMKRVCKEARIPTADWADTDRVSEGRDLVRRFAQDYGALPVIKADGLCAGKGVVVPENEEHAFEALDDLIAKRVHGAAGVPVLIEERLSGEECSVLALCDGENAMLLPPARDYKRLSAARGAPNTGGMGAYAPVPGLDAGLLATVRERIFFPALARMAIMGIPYHGILYAGLMLTREGPKLLEFNCRFGDPEAQVILPLLDCDLMDYLLACTETGGLAKLPPPRVKDASAVCVVAAASGYPGRTFPGEAINTRAARHDYERGMLVFHAGTEKNARGELVTAGGRVLDFVGVGPTIETARKKAYDGIERVDFPGMQFRKDIAEDA